MWAKKIINFEFKTFLNSNFFAEVKVFCETGLIIVSGINLFHNKYSGKSSMIKPRQRTPITILKPPAAKPNIEDDGEYNVNGP